MNSSDSESQSSQPKEKEVSFLEQTISISGLPLPQKTSTTKNKKLLSYEVSSSSDKETKTISFPGSSKKRPPSSSVAPTNAKKSKSTSSNKPATFKGTYAPAPLYNRKERQNNSSSNSEVEYSDTEDQQTSSNVQVSYSIRLTNEEKQKRAQAADNLNNLDSVFNDDDMEDFVEERLESLLEDLEYLWKFDTKLDFNTRAGLICENIGINTDINKLIPRDIENVIQSHDHIFFTTLLYQRFNFAGYISPDYPKTQEYLDRFQKILDIQYHCLEMLHGYVRLNYVTETDQNLSSSLGLMRFQSQFNIQEQSKLNKVIMWFLNDLSQKQLRRKGDSVYQKILAESEGKIYFAYAWERKCSIKEYCYSAVNPDQNADIFNLLASNIESAAKFLTYIKTSYFPDIEENPFYCSFKNGVYYLARDIFYPYDTNKPITCAKRGIVPYKKFADMDQENEEDFLYQKLSSDIVCFNHIPTDFRHKYNLTSMQIKTPVDCILDTQKLPEDVKWWVWALTGRGLYPLKTRTKIRKYKVKGSDQIRETEIKESWEVSLNLIGYAGTGKSTWLSPFFKIFKLEQIGVISNNIEHQWALSSMVDEDRKCKRVCIGPDLKKNFQWDQAEYQQCVSGEKVLVAIKKLTAFSVEFSAPIFFGMNEFFSRWKDSQDSLKRRMLFLYFDHFVPKDKKNMGIKEEIDARLDLILQKYNKAYIESVNKYGDQFIWKVLPKYFEETSDQCIQSMNPLLRFLSDTDVFVREDDVSVPFETFKQAYRFWHETEIGVPKNINWSKEFYGAIFDNMRLTIDTIINGSNSQKIIKGLQFNENFLELMKSNPKYTKYATNEVPSNLQSKKRSHAQGQNIS